MNARNAEEVSTTASTMSEKIVERLGDIVVAGVETTAQFSLGQGLLRAADRFLWVVEKSAQWSLPVQEITAEENGKAFGKIELVRPLPWIFFLPSLVMLRVLRFGVNVGAVILGYSKLEVIELVKIIQKGRRRLRSIKSNGLKNIRSRKSSRNREEELNEAKKSLINSMLSTLSALSCLETSRRTPSPPPTRVYVQHSEPNATATPGEESTTESTSPQIDGKRKYSEVEIIDDSSELSDEESVRAKLERLGGEDSEVEDEDYDPVTEEMKIVSGCDESSADEDRDEEGEEDDDDDDYLSDTEIEDLHRFCAETAKLATTAGVVNEVIVEEPETQEEASSTPKEEKGMITCENSEDNNSTSNPDTPIDNHDENTLKFYSPINSPINSPSCVDEKVIDFHSSPKEKNDDLEQPITPPIQDESLKNSSQITETQLDNGNPEKKHASSSGNSADEIDTTIINKNNVNKNNENGRTEDEIRSKSATNLDKIQDMEINTKLLDSDKK